MLTAIRGRCSKTSLGFTLQQSSQTLNRALSDGHIPVIHLRTPELGCIHYQLNDYPPSLLDDRRAAFPPSLSIIIAVFYATSVGIYLRDGSGKKEHCEETEMCLYQCTDLGTCWYHLIYDILLHEAKRDAVFKAEKILFFR